jgi:hypothetical protein
MVSSASKSLAASAMMGLVLYALHGRWLSQAEPGKRFALDEADPLAKPKTLEQVGEMIGVTKERVRQIQNKALQKIRVILEESYLAA